MIRHPEVRGLGAHPTEDKGPTYIKHNVSPSFEHRTHQTACCHNPKHHYMKGNKFRNSLSVVVATI